MFPDAEGWENVDPEEAAKWSVGSEFASEPLEQRQTEGGSEGQRTIVIKISSSTSLQVTIVRLLLNYDY